MTFLTRSEPGTRSQLYSGRAGVAVVLLVLPLFHSLCVALPFENWSYDRLSNEADVVVIGRPVLSRDPREGERLEVESPPGYEEYVKPAITEFLVRAVLAGNHVSEELLLEHLAEREGAPPLGNGPHLIKFRTSRANIRGEGFAAEVDHEYLMFLRRLDNGHYRPVADLRYMPVSIKLVIRPY